MIRARRRHFALVALLALAACGPTGRQKTLSAALVTVNVTADAFDAWNTAHMAAINDAHPYREDAEAALAAYRVKREPVRAAFAVAYQAIAAAALDTSTPLPTVIAVLHELTVSIATLKGATP